MFEKLSKEALEKVKQAKTKEEALGLLKDNGIALTEDDLANISGGDGCVIDLPPHVPCDHDCNYDIGCFTNQSCPTWCAMDTICPLNIKSE